MIAIIKTHTSLKVLNASTKYKVELDDFNCS